MQKENKYDLAERRYNFLHSLLKGIDAKLEVHNLLSKDILDFEEAHIYLRISDSALYKLTAREEIPFTKPGGKKMYFRRVDLDSWISGESTQAEIDREEAARKLINNLNLPQAS